MLKAQLHEEFQPRLNFKWTSPMCHRYIQSPDKNQLLLHWINFSPASRGEVPTRCRQAGILLNQAENSYVFRFSAEILHVNTMQGLD